jgi:hypothetical protein
MQLLLAAGIEQPRLVTLQVANIVSILPQASSICRSGQAKQ